MSERSHTALILDTLDLLERVAEVLDNYSDAEYDSETGRPVGNAAAYMLEEVEAMIERLR